MSHHERLAGKQLGVVALSAYKASALLGQNRAFKLYYIIELFPFAYSERMNEP